MPLISPLQLASDALREIEHSRALPAAIQNLSKKAQLQHILDKNGMSLVEIADNLKQIAYGAEKEETRFKANELALRLHEVLRDEKEATAPTIVFQIQGEAVNLAFLKPLGA